MPFKFDFGRKETDPPADADLDKTNDERKCAEGKEHFMDETHLEHIGEDAVLLENPELGLIHLSGEEVEIDLKRDEKLFDSAESGASDLVPGIYEGGLKIWECAVDLARHMEKENVDGKCVLELGCGAALPGLVCVRKGAHIVDFQDYNFEVIDRLTIPNVLLNAPKEGEGSTEDGVRPECRFFSGDWRSLEEILPSSKYDLILTSETIYNLENQETLLSLFQKCLKEGGSVLVAAKVHYFGVGGGVRQFEDVAAKSSWTTENVAKIDGGVLREINRLTRSKSKSLKRKSGDGEIA